MTQLKRDEALLTVAQVCEITKISRSTVYKLIEDKVIPSIRLGSSLIRVPKEKLYETLDGGFSGE